MTDKKKRVSPIEGIKGLAKKLPSTLETIKAIKKSNRKIYIETPGCFVKVKKKEKELARGELKDIVIIDPDLIVYVDEHNYKKVSMIISKLNQKLKGETDLSTPAAIIASASMIKTTLIQELDTYDMEYVFI